MARRITITVIEEPDIIEELQELLEQATTEQSHFYVAKCVRHAIDEIARLRAKCGEN